uniref:Uncharacterized protein n=1 Tax=Lactuca sativa TaxID=4236 RepID=A0A9R1UZJ4_LACSA|nr:hypothetical protein LSAT_V11C700369730 [Lactuca sativa]
MQATPNDVESSSARDFSQYMQVTPPRSYECEEGVVGDEAIMGEEAEKSGNVQDDEVITNIQVVTPPNRIGGNIRGWMTSCTVS